MALLGSTVLTLAAGLALAGTIWLAYQYGEYGTTGGRRYNLALAALAALVVALSEGILVLAVPYTLIAAAALAAAYTSPAAEPADRVAEEQ